MSPSISDVGCKLAASLHAEAVLSTTVINSPSSCFEVRRSCTRYIVWQRCAVLPGSRRQIRRYGDDSQLEPEALLSQARH